MYCTSCVCNEGTRLCKLCILCTIHQVLQSCYMYKWLWNRLVTGIPHHLQSVVHTISTYMYMVWSLNCSINSLSSHHLKFAADDSTLSSWCLEQPFDTADNLRKGCDLMVFVSYSTVSLPWEK